MDSTDTPDNLLAQLSRRVQSFLSATGISQRRLAKLIKTDETHLANFLAGRTGLSAEKSLRLMQILNASRSELEAKLGKAATMQITHFQEKGKPMRLTNDGWVSGESGQDPNGTDDVNRRQTARDLDNADCLEQTIAMLRDQQQILRQADAHIEAYITNAQKAHPNATGNTGPSKQISRPKTAGPRRDLLR